MKKLMNNQSGFSLVELMVVVAIIGILATVAIPSVSKYMAKARQTEAKTSLASIYSANKAFFVEYNGYGTHFTIIGHSPEGQLRYNYGFGAGRVLLDYQNIGWGIGLAALPNAFIASNLVCGASATAAPVAGFQCWRLKETNTTGAVGGAVIPVPAANTADNTTFTAAALSRMNTGLAAGVYDTWTINQNKIVVNTVDGI